MPTLPSLSLLLASPRGFCAGVERAVAIVERALARWGAPVYVRHEIVHNRHVVDRLAKMGAVFVEEADAIPHGARAIVSAHGAPKRTYAIAESRGLLLIDATCPLVRKVHSEARRHHANGRKVLLVGHAGHPEVEGVMGQLPEGATTLVETPQDVDALDDADGATLAWATQTTLSVEDAEAMTTRIKDRFPGIAGPKASDICYATTNRQRATRLIAGRCEAMVVLGAANSSNSLRLVETARRHGCARAMLAHDADDIDWAAFGLPKVAGLTASASAPEFLVEGVVSALADRFTLDIETIAAGEETAHFALPRALTC